MKKTKIHHTAEVKSFSEPMKSPKKNSLPLIGAVVILVGVASFLLYKNVLGNNVNKFKKEIIPNAVKKILGDATTKFEIGTIKDTNGVYEFELTINPKNNPQKYVSYISKDGQILFTSGIKLGTLKAQPQTKGATTKKLTCADLPKIEKPKLTAFIVADCPYGLQTQRLFSKTMTELPDISQYLDIKYIGSVENGKIVSMHGDKEAQENLRQICIREEQKDKYWPYVSCYMQEGKSEDCLLNSEINADQLKNCTTDKNKGLAYAQKDFATAKKFSVSGSPTLIINDKQTVSEFDFGGRNADSIKKIVCCASKTQGEYCTQDLSKTDVASSYSLTVDAAAGTTTTGSADQQAACATQ